MSPGKGGLNNNTDSKKDTETESQAAIGSSPGQALNHLKRVTGSGSQFRTHACQAMGPMNDQNVVSV